MSDPLLTNPSEPRPEPSQTPPPPPEPEVARRHCLNCGHPVGGSFCPVCGQEDKVVKRPVVYFIRELLRVVFELDGRAYQTLLRLLTRPGFLTLEYFAGRRMSYTPPLRLFLVVSLGFFLLISVFSKLQAMRSAMTGSMPDDPPARFELTVEADGEEAATDELDVNLDANFEGVFSALEELDLPFLSVGTNRNLQVALTAQLKTNLEEIMADPEEFFLDSLEYITFFILLMMPILALIQQIFWFFSRRYFVEHLVLTVHNHTFILLMLFVTMIVGVVDDLEIPVLGTVADILGILAVGWVFVYLYLSLRHYFGASWLITGLLFVAATVAYASVLSSGLFLFMILLVLFA